MTRRGVSFIAALVLCLVGALPSGVIAQDAPSESVFAGLDLPELNVTATPDAYEGIPDEIEAGRYLLTFTATEDTEDTVGAAIAFIQPAGMTGQEFIDLVTTMAEEPDGESLDSTPDAMPEENAAAEAEEAITEGESPEGENGDEAEGPPEWFFESIGAGGVSAYPDQTVQAVVDLGPGEWVAWGDFPGAPWEPVVIEVTGDMPTDLPEPESSATLTMDEYLITVSEGELVTGPQIVKLENIGEQPHFLIWALGPDDMKGDQIQTILDEEMEAEMTGTPAAYSDLNPEEDITDIAATGTQSSDTAMWLSVDLEPGAYVVICFFPDRGDGMPHAFHGMYNVIRVEA